MSVSQVKKRFEELATYLGRDTLGLEKLKALKDAVNELRTQLASAQEKAERETELTEAATQRAHMAERELAIERSEVHRLMQINQNLSRDLQIAAAADPADAETEDTASIPTESEFKPFLKLLRKRLKFCPRPTRRITTPKLALTESGMGIGVWDRETIAKDWSHESLWTLGATLAVLALFDGAAVLQSQVLFKDMELKDSNSYECVNRVFIQWLQRNIDWNDTTLKAGPVRLVNTKPSLP